MEGFKKEAALRTSLHSKRESQETSSQSEKSLLGSGDVPLTQGRGRAMGVSQIPLGKNTVGKGKEEGQKLGHSLY